MKNARLLRLTLLLTILLYALPFGLTAQTVKKADDISFREMDSLFTWFRQNPPAADGANFTTRWAKTKAFDTYGFELSDKTWGDYHRYWKTDPLLAAAMEKSYPVLYYLNKAVEQSVADIVSTKVTHGAVIWKLYNMGYIVKTKDACFALDLNQRGSEQLVDMLDFAVVSHIHGDHNNTIFLDAMVAAGKKVYTPFYKKGTLIDTTREFNFGGVNVRFTMNKQADVPVIVAQINCGPSANNYTIYHIGDSRTLEELNPTRHINLFILHIENAINTGQSVARVKPDVTIYDHVMELGHAVDKWRWSYQYTYNKIKGLDPAKSLILTWGERLEVGGYRL
ncbi:hypothetical protein [Mucilaginibacter sp. UYCu711]|uniref:hypothetical protein n=1 Tax=Mucilaginibacter sp. UYCu711 TaxID=3156339 RepID=UPI003D1B7F35